MAVYKVPQDVEADDKLIGPFSFRQFIYLLIVAGAIAIAWVLGNLFIPLAIIPLPIILFFGALALPLRKDQPMETYLAAIVSFYLKPRRRKWDPDGIQSLIEITAPKVVEIKRSKDLSQNEAEQRLSYLAQIVDSQGWSVRGAQAPGSTPTDTPDLFDIDTPVARSMDTRLDLAAAKQHQEVVERMRHPAPAPTAASTQPTPAFVPAPINDPYTTLPTVAPEPVIDEQTTPHLSINPYPTSMHQSVVAPIDPNAPKPADKDASSTSETTVSPDIMNLANNTDLSIETIAHEANRLKEKEKLPEDEVVISLR